MGKRVLRGYTQSTSKAVSCVACLLGTALWCLPLASAAGRFGVDAHDGLAVVDAGMQDLTPLVTQQYDRVFGVCQLTSADGSGLSIAAEATTLLEKQEHRNISGQARISVIEMPKHGELEDAGNGNFAYSPEDGYIGNDRASLLVEVGGKKIRMEYFFRVMQSVPQQYESEPPIHEQGYCPVKARVWKISSTPDVNGNSTLIATELSPFTTDTTEGKKGMGSGLALRHCTKG